MKITPVHRRVAVGAVLFLSGIGFGVTLGTATTEPEVITISEDVPTACSDAARSATAGFKAWENLDQYETNSRVLAADLTMVTLIGDASKIEEALAPIAQHNEKEAKWRVKRDDARLSFETAATECLNKARAAEAADAR